MAKIAVILGSVRQHGVGINLFNYLKNQKSDIETSLNVELTFLNLREYNLPVFDEDVPPMANQNRQLPDNQQQWLDDIQGADGYILMSPEYNHSLPGGLKNALDYLAFQAQGKPVKTLGYSDNSRGGQFGVAALIPVLQRLEMIVLPKPALIGNIPAILDPKGTIIDDQASTKLHGGVIKMFKEISFYTTLLTANPFPRN